MVKEKANQQVYIQQMNHLDHNQVYNNIINKNNKNNMMNIIKINNYLINKFYNKVL